MEKFSQEPSKTAEWHVLVLEAQIQSGYRFEDCLENYLVLTLDYFTKEGELSSSILAIDFLLGLDGSERYNSEILRNVGDRCLLLSGLFPEHALQKNVSLNYFISIGQQAYKTLATIHTKHELDPELFFKLSNNFIGLMDVLHAIRQMPANNNP